MLTSIKSHWARVTVTIQREMPEFIFLEIWTPNSPDLNPVGYSRVCVSFKTGSTHGHLVIAITRCRWHLVIAITRCRWSTVRGSMMWMKERLLREWRLLVLDHSILSPAPLHPRTLGRYTNVVLLLGRVALGAQRPIVVKLSRGRSVGLSVRTYVRALVGRSIQCIMEKRRIGSGCRLAS